MKKQIHDSSTLIVMIFTFTIAAHTTTLYADSPYPLLDIVPACEQIVDLSSSLKDAKDEVINTRKSLEDLKLKRPQEREFSPQLSMGEFEPKRDFELRKKEANAEARRQFQDATSQWQHNVAIRQKALSDSEKRLSKIEDALLSARRSIKELTPFHITGHIDSTGSLPRFNRESMSFSNISISGIALAGPIYDKTKLFSLKLTGNTSFKIKAESLKTAERFKKAWDNENVVVSYDAWDTLESIETPIILEPARTEPRDWKKDAEFATACVLAAFFGSDSLPYCPSPSAPAKNIPAKTRDGYRLHFVGHVENIQVLSADKKPFPGVSVILDKDK